VLIGSKHVHIFFLTMAMSLFPFTNTWAKYCPYLSMFCSSISLPTLFCEGIKIAKNSGNHAIGSIPLIWQSSMSAAGVAPYRVIHYSSHTIGSFNLQLQLGTYSNLQNSLSYSRQ
jgi:hypothetical protein